MSLLSQPSKLGLRETICRGKTSWKVFFSPQPSLRRKDDAELRGKRKHFVAKINDLSSPHIVSRSREFKSRSPWFSQTQTAFVKKLASSLSDIYRKLYLDSVLITRINELIACLLIFAMNCSEATFVARFEWWLNLCLRGICTFIFCESAQKEYIL